MGTSPPRQPDETDTDVVSTPTGSSRRRFLTRAAAGGAVLAVGSQLLPAGGLVPSAFAQDGGANDEDQDGELSPDEVLIAHLAGLSLAAAQGYGLSVDPERSPLSEPVTEIVRQLGANHTSQAAVLNELLPVAVETTNATLAQQLTTDLNGASDEAAVLAVLLSLEESMAATSYAMLGELEDQNDAKNVAALLPATSQQAVVLGSLAGTPPIAELVPEQQTTEGQLAVADYPALAAGDAPETSSETPVGNEGGTGADAGDGAGEEGTGQPGDGTSSSGGGADDGSGAPTTEG